MGYFLKNEMNNEMAYFKDSYFWKYLGFNPSGTYPSINELKLMMKHIFEIKNWDEKDQIFIFITSIEPSCYIYQGGKYEQKEIVFSGCENPSEWKEFDSDEDDEDDTWETDDSDIVDVIDYYEDDRYEESFLTGKDFY